MAVNYPQTQHNEAFAGVMSIDYSDCCYRYAQADANKACKRSLPVIKMTDWRLADTTPTYSMFVEAVCGRDMNSSVPASP